MIKRFYHWLLKKVFKPEEGCENTAGYWTDKVRNVAIELCRKKRGKLLEMGCGEGIFLDRLGSSDSNATSYGLDNSILRLCKAKKRFEKNRLKNTSLICGEATNLPFKDGSFDNVVCINVLLAMPSLDIFKKALREIGRVCKSGGFIIFEFRNALNPLLNLKYKFAPFYDSTAKTLSLVTCRPDEIKLFLKEMNFEITQRPYVSFPRGRFTPIIFIEARKL